LGGVWGSSCALVAAALERSCPATLVVVLPHARDIDDFRDDLALFTDAAVDAFPAWESDASERVLHDEIFGARLRLLKQLQAASRSFRIASEGGQAHFAPKTTQNEPDPDSS
jgi:transcription-repair coupling factor (superfamily II helicase)